MRPREKSKGKTLAESFKDHFSKQAALYAKYRPGYPADLFADLAALAPSRDLAVDVATGSGQAALGLADHFARVIACDASAAQLAGATPHERVEYRVTTAEELDLPDACADLVAVAQALHWFDFDRFFARVRAVLRDGGVIAAWSYRLHTVNDAIDPLTHDFYENIVGPYWPPERAHVEAEYRTIPFPFDEIPMPPRAVRLDWTLPVLMGYLRSWSATQRFVDVRGFDPVDDLEARIAPRWGDPDAPRAVTWPVVLRVGRV